MKTSFMIGSPLVGGVVTEMRGVTKNGDGSVRVGAEIAGGEERTLEANIWLPRAAEAYNLSKDINDYVLVPVPAIVTDIPNTNGDSVSLKQLTAFNTEQGQLAYRTWIGKPMYVEHRHKPEWMRGIILDTYIRPLHNFPKHFKLVMLAALDRSRDPALIQQVIDRKLNTYSMGMYYTSYSCSICNQRIGKGFGVPCAHTKARKPTYRFADGRLVYRMCEGITGFELSLLTNPGRRSGVDGYTQGLGDPSYVSAIGDHLILPELFKK